MPETPARLGYRMPAEWEEHEGTWLSWPKDPNTFSPGILPAVEEAYVKMVSALAPGEEVKILVNDERTEMRVRSLLPHADGVSFHRIKTVDVWVRDYGPTYVIGRGIALVKWRFNAWGNKYEDLLPDDGSGETIAQSSGLPIFRPGIVLEGGSIDVDGDGTIMTTEQCLLNPNRNPGTSRREIEGLFDEYLSAHRTIWLGSGIEGDDTDGHVDDIARFVAPGKVLVGRETRTEDPNHAILRTAELALEVAADTANRRLEVIEVPMPPYQASPEGRLPASHLNFYIGNESVLLPTFGGESDNDAKSILEASFPRHEITPIDCRALVHGLGTIHCVTQQVPKAR